MRGKIVLPLVAGLLAALAASAQTGTAAATSFSLDAEALLWWLRGVPAAPPLVTTGVLGQTGTRVLAGGQERNLPKRAGLRLTAAFPLAEDWSGETSIFFLRPVSGTRSIASPGLPGTPNLAIPFFDPTLPGESATRLSSNSTTPRFAGQAIATIYTRLFGAELNGVVLPSALTAVNGELLGGFRYLNFREIFTFATNSPNLQPPLDIFQTQDRFAATNSFYGGQAGVRAHFHKHSWGADAAVKVALGVMAQAVDVGGYLLTNSFNGYGTAQAYSGGYFTQPTNIGHHARNTFAVVSEAGINLHYEFTPRTAFFLGCTYLAISDVVRPTRQIDREINPSQSPAISRTAPGALSGQARPTFRFQPSYFWAQGFNAGLAFRF